MYEKLNAPSLVVTAPALEQGRRLFVTSDEILLGRSDACDMAFADPRMSRAHALLWRADGSVYVADAGSSGGTFVNRHRLDGPWRLRPGDLVTLAGVTMRFEGEIGGGEPTQLNLPPVPKALARIASAPMAPAPPAGRYPIVFGALLVLDTAGVVVSGLPAHVGLAGPVALGLAALLMAVGVALIVAGLLRRRRKLPPVPRPRAESTKPWEAALNHAVSGPQGDRPLPRIRSVGA